MDAPALQGELRSDANAIIAMGFCYPGRADCGDNPPRPECAPRWHEKLNAHVPDIALTLLIGRYAHDHYLGARHKATLGETVQGWKEYLLLGYLPLARRFTTQPAVARGKNRGSKRKLVGNDRP